jgi:peptidase M49-like protein
MCIVERAGALAAALSLAACAGTTTPPVVADPRPMTPMQQKLSKYTPVRLVVDTASLTAGERRMIPLLIDAARAMDDVFWLQAYGDREALVRSIIDPDARRLVEINYGPWDRLDDDRPFIPDVGEKPKGANFYPRDMTDAEFQAAVAESPERGAALKSLYTLVRREPGGKLVTVPYHEAYAEQVQRAAAGLRAAAPLAEQASLRRYLELRANALESDDYQPSDLAWMEMKDNIIDVVVGPIETYEDQRYGYKAAHEAFVLIKDRAWSGRLARYAAFLPALQEGLPVSAELKREKPGTDSDLNAYDAVYYAGQANAGAKTIAINLPNDEEVQLKKGARRLQLKNAMRAKFDKILLPIARELIADDELGRVKFDAFFQNVMFHEVAHGLGIKNTITGRGTVRTALKEKASALEEGKADVLGLYMVTALNARGELAGEDVRDNFVTFLASLFRSVRFGAADAHGRANIAQFNFLHRRGAFTRDGRTGRYRVNFDKMQPALDALSSRILTLQGNGDYDGGVAFEAEFGTISPELQRDLDRLSAAGIPVDIVFEQGVERP